MIYTCMRHLLPCVCFLFSVSVLAEDMQELAEDVQEVYQYRNNEGAMEFTDQLKPDETLLNHMQIKKMTPEEEALSKEKLDQIIEKDNELDEKRALRNQLENERRLRLQKERELEELKKEQTENNKSDNDHDHYYWRRPPKVRPPVKPEPPLHKPTWDKPPLKPKHPIQKPPPPPVTPEQPIHRPGPR